MEDDKIQMTVPRWKRIQFWTFLINEKVPRPKGVTDRRLEKAKETILANDFLWSDVVLRHGASGHTAKEFYEAGGHYAEHSRSNFWAIVREIISRADG